MGRIQYCQPGYLFARDVEYRIIHSFSSISSKSESIRLESRSPCVHWIFVVPCVWCLVCFACSPFYFMCVCLASVVLFAQFVRRPSPLLFLDYLSSRRRRRRTVSLPLPPTKLSQFLSTHKRLVSLLHYKKLVISFRVLPLSIMCGIESTLFIAGGASCTLSSKQQFNQACVSP